MKNNFLGKSEAKRIDDNVRKVLREGTNVAIKGKDTYAKAKISSSDTLSIKDIRRAVKTLKKNSIPLIPITQFTLIRGEYKNRWWLRPICWIWGHQFKKINIYSLVRKQCKRCGKEKLRIRILKGWNRSTYSGEIGELYKVRYITTKGKRKKTS